MLVVHGRSDIIRKMAARRIAFLNCKGGVGKTSLAVNVAAALAKEEKQNVLLVDLDAQCNASIWLMGIPRWLPLDGMLDRTVCAFFKTKKFLSGAVHKSVLEYGNPARKMLDRLDLIPAVYELLDLDHGPEKKGAVPYYLEFYRQIEPLAQEYDYIIFDCPPALGRASKCAAFCSPEIYIPAHPDFLSSLGIKLLSDRLGNFLREAKPATLQIVPKWKPTKVRGVILNAVPGTADTVDAKNNIRARLKHEQGSTAISSTASILQVEVRESITAARLAGKYRTTGVPAVLAAGDNPSLADDYIKLAHYLHIHPV
jgi:chromosome partitioning protein